MDILQFIKSRRSIRKFIDKPVGHDDITKILEAARWAPSAGNCQPWRFIVVTDKKKKMKFDPFLHQPWVENAQVIVELLWLYWHHRRTPGSVTAEAVTTIFRIVQRPFRICS